MRDRSLRAPAPADPPAEAPPARSRLREHIDLFLDNRWTIAKFVAAALLLGALYTLFGPRVYEANVLLQVEDAERSGGTLLGESASSALNAKTPTAGEAEILKSRLVLGQAIEDTKLYIEARPLYLPLVGAGSRAAPGTVAARPAGHGRLCPRRRAHRRRADGRAARARGLALPAHGGHAQRYHADASEAGRADRRHGGRAARRGDRARAAAPAGGIDGRPAGRAVRAGAPVEAAHAARAAARPARDRRASSPR